MMSPAVAGAATLACSDICSTSAFAGIWGWALALEVRRFAPTRMSVSTLFAGVGRHLVRVGPVLALTAPALAAGAFTNPVSLHDPALPGGDRAGFCGAIVTCLRTSFANY